MSSYTGSYTNDLGIIFNQVSLNIYLIENSNNEAQVRNTSKTFDSLFIPSILNSHFQNLKAVCSITQGTNSIRQGVITLSETEKLYIPCPFRGGSSQFDEFFRQLNSNPAALVVELSPETISQFYLRHYSKMR